MYPRTLSLQPDWLPGVLYCTVLYCIAMYYSSECGGENGGKKGQGAGVRLAVMTSIAHAARPPEFNSDSC